MDNKEALKAQLTTLAQDYTQLYDQTKELNEKKKELEESLKNVLEENKIKNLSFADKKISYSSSVRQLPVKTSDVLEIVHKLLLEKEETRMISEDFMEAVHQEIEAKKKTSTVRVLRVIHQQQ